LLKRAEFERETASVCKEYGIGVIPYSPLARGFLTGKYRKDQEIPKDSREYKNERIKGYFTENNWALLELMEKIGEANGGKSISQVALAWQLSDPLITSPIIGPRNMEQFNDNFGAVGFRLSAEDKTALDKATAWE
jgi:aryl-alcohol dehydrogenase-like predicted oxidoreductase